LPFAACNGKGLALPLADITLRKKKNLSKMMCVGRRLCPCIPRHTQPVHPGPQYVHCTCPAKISHFAFAEQNAKWLIFMPKRGGSLAMLQFAPQMQHGK